MRRLLWLPLIIFGGIFLLLSWLVATSSGTSWLVETVAEKIDGLQLTVREGRLLDHLNLAGIDYEKDGLSISLEGLTSNYSLKAILRKKLLIKQLNIETLRVELPGSPRSNSADVSTSIQFPVFTSPVQVEVQSFKIAEIILMNSGKISIIKDFVLVGEINGAVLHIEKLKADMSDHRVDFKSTVTFEDAFPIQINADIQALKDASSMQLSVDGVANDYVIKAAANLVKNPIPEMSFDLHGQGSLQQLKLVKTNVQTLNGAMDLSGMISWLEELTLDLNYKGLGIDPGQYDDRYPGAIDFIGSTKTTEGELQTDLQVQGRLRGHPVKLNTQFALEDSAMHIETAKINVGGNTFDVQGGITGQGVSDFSFAINASELKQLSPDLSGRLTGQGTANGTWEALELQAFLQANSLGFAQTRLDRLSLEITPTDKAFEYALKAKAIGIQASQITLKTVELNSIVSRERQKSRFNISGGPSGLTATGGLEGNYKDNAWEGVIRGVTFSADNLPVYVQTEETKLQLSSKNKRVSPFCLEHESEEICLEASQTLSADTQIIAKLSKFPLKRLAPWIPAATVFSDHFDGMVVAKMINDIWNIEATTSLDNNNQLKAKIEYQQQSNRISGKVAANFNKLDWINLFTDKVIATGGSLNADLSLGGSLLKPEIEGIIDLQKMNVRVSDTGVEYTDVDLYAKLQADQTATFKGSALSGGTLTLNGGIDWKRFPVWVMDTHIAGENVQMMHLPIGNVSISPALDVSANADGVRLEGNITIPDAQINLGDLPDSAIKPSSDEIIVGFKQEDNEMGLPVTAKIKLLLGDSVRVTGYGLETRLEGGLQIDQEPGEPVRVDGTLELLEGSYKAYGQDLVIERGEIYFNGPLEPHLNIRATRTIEAASVVAGLQLKGTLELPESNVFATPSMSQSQALSYLLTGKPLGDTEEGESDFLMNAAIGLGIKGSAGVIEDIRAETGLDTVEINAGQDSTQTYLALGKYLSPRFYIQYATRLFNDSQVFSMRYQLTKKLFLEAETGDDEDAVDLMYQFEQ